MNWLIHGDSEVNPIANTLLCAYRVGIPILLRDKSVLLIRW